MTKPDLSGLDSGCQVGEFFSSLLAQLESWARGMGSAFEDFGSPSRAQIDAVIQPMAEAMLDRKELPLVGAGFVAAHNVLSDAEWHMAWWQGAAQERLLMLTMESAGETYSRREWFTVPMETGRGHITGPYVDFLCTDEYTLTLSVPVWAEGKFVGIAGVDMFVESVEELLMGELENIDSRATLINGSGRVILSVEPQLAAGRLLVPGWKESAEAVLPVAGEDVGFSKVELRPCRDLPLAVVIPM